MVLLSRQVRLSKYLLTILVTEFLFHSIPETSVRRDFRCHLLHLRDLDSLPQQDKLFQLLLRREWLTRRLAHHGKCYPPAILARACIYEALEYDDLATFDAFVVYQLCQKELSDEFVTDLEASEPDGGRWLGHTPDDEQRKFEIRQVKVDTMAILVRCFAALGALKDANSMLNELKHETRLTEYEPVRGIRSQLIEPPIKRLVYKDWDLSAAEAAITTDQFTRFGMSRREVYPWSNYEPDRNSPESLSEINHYLAQITFDLEARMTWLPAFDVSGQATGETSSQLGLFAKKDLRPGTEVLHEKSVLTAIRPLEDAICDACGQELEGLPFEQIAQCDGADCDTTFCSEDCKLRSVKEYHYPAMADEIDHEVDAVYRPENELTTNSERLPTQGKEQTLVRPAPFCGNEDLNYIGRSSNTDTPEWDLYFLLLTRTTAMSITQQTHPLHLREIKHLWADFNPCPFRPGQALQEQPELKQKLPFSVQHTLQYVLDYFSTLSLSYPEATPYSANWLENFDFWVIQTLFAKFRGVANATQSTFDGKPEIASVHPGWCLANHSCAPNVRWTPKGERQFYVRTQDERTWLGNEGAEHWQGIEADEEIFSHYTDVRLPLQERRERLREVLGGECRCERCLTEARNS